MIIVERAEQEWHYFVITLKQERGFGWLLKELLGDRVEELRSAFNLSICYHNTDRLMVAWNRLSWVLFVRFDCGIVSELWPFFNSKKQHQENGTRTRELPILKRHF